MIYFISILSERLFVLLFLSDIELYDPSKLVTVSITWRGMSKGILFEIIHGILVDACVMIGVILKLNILDHTKQVSNLCDFVYIFRVGIP